MINTQVQTLSGYTCICTSAIYSLTTAIAGLWELEDVPRKSTCTSTCTFYRIEKNGWLRIAVQCRKWFRENPNFFIFIACWVRNSVFRTNRCSRGEMWLNRQTDEQTELTTVTLAAHAKYTHTCAYSSTCTQASYTVLFLIELDTTPHLSMKPKKMITQDKADVTAVKDNDLYHLLELFCERASLTDKELIYIPFLW